MDNSNLNSKKQSISFYEETKSSTEDHQDSTLSHRLDLNNQSNESEFEKNDTCKKSSTENSQYKKYYSSYSQYIHRNSDDKESQTIGKDPTKNNFDTKTLSIAENRNDVKENSNILSTLGIPENWENSIFSLSFSGFGFPDFDAFRASEGRLSIDLEQEIKEKIKLSIQPPAKKKFGPSFKIFGLQKDSDEPEKYEEITYSSYHEELEIINKKKEELMKEKEEERRRAEIELNRKKKIDEAKKKREDKEKNLLEEKIEIYKRKDCAMEEIDLKKEILLMQYVDTVFDSKRIQRSLNILEGKLFSTHEKYSDQEKDALLSEENFILLGRSGTGKTMVALTKIFLLKMCSSLKETKSLIQDIVDECPIKVIFCTTSPKLIEEVTNYYSIMEKKFMERINVEYQPIERFDSHAFDLIQEKHYPLFITSLHLIFLIDSILDEPLFSRNILGQIISNGLNIDWYAEENISYKVSDDFYFKIQKKRKSEEEEEKKEEEEEEEKEERKNQNFINVKLLDFKEFQRTFWKSCKKKIETLNLTPLVVWSEIMSYIKGAPNSYQYEKFHLKLEDYIKYIGTHKTFLNSEDKIKIWHLAQDFEKWKMENNFFDLMDVISYLLQEITQEKYRFNQKPHAIFIDEVQDMQPSILFLLTLLAQKQIIFCGDTAQTIAKGIDFRFSDLKKLFFFGKKLENVEKFPLVPQDLSFKILNINFRSQAKIIELSNAIIGILELLFPTSLDKIKKEIPVHKGKKSIFLSEEALLFKLFEKFNQEGISFDKPTFGYSFTILVKDKITRERLKEAFAKYHAPVFTIYESKGLEFDNVILYNFFTDSECLSSEWEILSDLEVYEKIIDPINYTERPNFELNNGLTENDNHYLKFDPLSSEHSQSKKIKAFKKSGKIANLNLLQHEDLKNELKVLYTAITRTRLRLIIYDKYSKSKSIFENLLSSFDLFDYLIEENFDSLFEIKDKNESMGYERLSFKKENLENQDLQNAFKYFNFKFYWQAYVLFQKLNDKEHADMSKAHYYVDSAKACSEENNINQANEYYNQSAVLFEGIGMIKEAAKSYYAAENFEKASLLFAKAQMYSEAGKAILKIIEANQDKDKALSLYLDAITFFEKGNNFKEALQLCDQTNQLERALSIIVKFKSRMLKYSKALESYLRKFMKEFESKLKTSKVVNKSDFEKLIKIFGNFGDDDLKLNEKTISREVAKREIENINYSMYHEIIQQKNEDIFLIFYSMKEFACYEMGGKYAHSNKMKESHLFFLFSTFLEIPEFKNSISKSFFFESNENKELAMVKNYRFINEFNTFSLLEMNSVKAKLVLLAPNIVFNSSEKKTNFVPHLQEIFFDFKNWKNLKIIIIFKESNEKVKRILQLIHENNSKFINNFLNSDYHFLKEFKPNPSFEFYDNIISFLIEFCDYEFLPDLMPENIEIIKTIFDFYDERYFSLLQTHKFPFGKYLMPTTNDSLIKFSKEHSIKNEEITWIQIFQTDVYLIRIDMIIMHFFAKIFAFCFTLLYEMERNRHSNPKFQEYFSLQKSCRNLQILASKINKIYLSQTKYFNVLNLNELDELDILRMQNVGNLLSNKEILASFYKGIYNSFFSGLAQVDEFMIKIKESLLLLTFSNKYRRIDFLNLWNKNYKLLANEQMKESFNHIMLLMKLNELYTANDFKIKNSLHVSKYLTEFHLSYIASEFFSYKKWEIHAEDHENNIYYPHFHIVFPILKYINNTMKSILETVNVEKTNSLSEVQKKLILNFILQAIIPIITIGLLKPYPHARSSAWTDILCPTELESQLYLCFKKFIRWNKPSINVFWSDDIISLFKNEENTDFLLTMLFNIISLLHTYHIKLHSENNESNLLKFLYEIELLLIKNVNLSFIFGREENYLHMHTKMQFSNKLKQEYDILVNINYELGNKIKFSQSNEESLNNNVPKKKIEVEVAVSQISNHIDEKSNLKNENITTKEEEINTNSNVLNLNIETKNAEDKITDVKLNDQNNEIEMTSKIKLDLEISEKKNSNECVGEEILEPKSEKESTFIVEISKNKESENKKNNEFDNEICQQNEEMKQKNEIIEQDNDLNESFHSCYNQDVSYENDLKNDYDQNAYENEKNFDDIQNYSLNQNVYNSNFLQVKDNSYENNFAHCRLDSDEKEKTNDKINESDDKNKILEEKDTLFVDDDKKKGSETKTSIANEEKGILAIEPQAEDKNLNNPEKNEVKIIQQEKEIDDAKIQNSLKNGEKESQVVDQTKVDNIIKKELEEKKVKKEKEVEIVTIQNPIVTFKKIICYSKPKDFNFKFIYNFSKDILEIFESEKTIDENEFGIIEYLISFYDVNVETKGKRLIKRRFDHKKLNLLNYNDLAFKKGVSSEIFDKLNEFYKKIKVNTTDLYEVENFIMKNDKKEKERIVNLYEFLEEKTK